MVLDAIDFTTKTGFEEIICPERHKKLIDFWRWAYSDLIGNTERGNLAEYIVALACGIDDKVRISWNSYDLELNDGTRIEVKSSAYLQSWKQRNFSKPVFNIAKSFAWNYIENIYDTEKKRQSDIYVFALLAHKDQDTINPLDISQWAFFVISTKVLDTYVGDSKQITLKKLLKLKAVKCNFNDLLKTIVDQK